ncbi:YjbH domain-containing protein [Photobacterium sp. Alg240-V54]|uniref:YjbH domain-containing protein n=1 Tax=Photobacterium sp. Alg240-V54 TaxID=2305995 RepID=UPI0013D45C23|nr:YjbH domain-containing protein [Photobacterium sp. Alg240-V54]
MSIHSPLLTPKTLLSLSIIASFSMLPLHAQANQITVLPSSQSFSGLMFTPNAQVIKTGDISLSYHQGVAHNNSIQALDNWFFAAGLFPGLEAGGRIVTKTYNTNLYTDASGGMRDLSASAKYQLPFIYDYTGFNIAIGAQDIGGAANNFDTKYVVIDHEFDALSLRTSAGYARSSFAEGIMNGPFAGVEWQPLSFLQLTSEYDAVEINANAKLFSPQGLLPWGAQLSMDYQLYTGHERSEQNVWGVNIAMPLMGYNDNRQQNLNTNKQAQLEQQLNKNLAEHQSASLTNLINALQNEGFINLNVGYRKNKMVVALENRRYNHNQMDGVGVALGIITSKAGVDAFADLAKIAATDKSAQFVTTDKQNIELILLTNDIPMLTVTTDSQCYREFLATGNPCDQLMVNTVNAKKDFNNSKWLYHTLNNGFGRSQIILSPALNHRTATEYGVFDYSLALAANVYTPLWQGAAIDVRYMVPISDSDDFKQGGLWHNQAYENKVDRALLHQAVKLPQNIISQFSAGYMMGNYWGGVNETQWYSPQGNHILGFEVSKFIPSDDKDNNGRNIADKQSFIANYTYSLPEYNWQLGLQAGEYFQGDTGVRVTSDHWLGDSRLSINYLTTKPKNSNTYEDFLGVSIAIPLTPWRDMKPGYVQVRGTDQFVYSLQTRVGESHNNINTGLGATSDLQHNISRQYENRGRLSPAYFDANIQRLRNAYIRYIKNVEM